MAVRNFNWNDIRPVNNSLNDGFEELVCQLAKNQKIDGAKQFIRKGKPDAGVECLWALETNDEVCWQAKYFTNSFGTTQWRQIDDSVKTAIEMHPKMIRYIIAFPVDPSDARVRGKKSMLQKWEEYVSQWKQLAFANNRKVEFEAWWSSDLITKIQEAHPGFWYFWFNKEEFTEDWFVRQNDLTLANLGPRYTPELNQQLPISQIFDGLSHNERYVSYIYETAGDVVRIVKRIVDNLHEHYDLSVLRECIGDFDSIFLSYDPRDINVLDVDIVNGILSSIKQQAYDLSYKLQDESRYYTEYSQLRDLIKLIYDFERYVSSPVVALANKPFLLLSGTAGCGKSHLFGDVVTKRKSEHSYSIFVLGSHFCTCDDPWQQILKQCDVKCGVDDFLYSLNTIAQIKKNRIIIFIDAANEGNGKNFWHDYINSFIQRLGEYEWLGFAMSVRSTYVEHMFPENILSSNTVVKCNHRGFEGVTYDAIKLFFQHYNIELINSPLLVPEFNNPLFLSLFCRGLSKAGHTRVPLGESGLSSILNRYMQGVNTFLAAPNRLDYDDSLEVVRMAVEALAIARIQNKNQPLSVNRAAEIVSNISLRYGVKNGLFKALVDEHIISKDLGGEGNETVEFSYERLQDYYSASYLVNNTDIKTAFQSGGDFHFIVEDSNRCYYNSGLLEALSFILPERTGLELYEVLPCPSEFSVVESFVDSLIWRDPDTILVEKITPYIDEVVLSNEYFQITFWDTVLQVAAVPSHPLNALWLHDYLMSFSMSDRDAWWTIWLKNNYFSNSTIGKIIQWGYTTICDDPDTIKLMSIVLTWFHTSSNRELRDRSTKAMICLLNGRIDILLNILMLFEEVDDPYVLERLYAVAYGSVLRNNYNIEHYSSLVRYIYQVIFDKDEVYPHILLRDYARNVIEYYVHKGYPVDFSIEDVRPPYKSTFKIEGLSNAELDAKYDFDDISDTERYRYSAHDILHSMTTEYGRGCCGYGDFGRYTFEAALDYWKVDCNILSNIAVEWIFEKYGYDVEKHGKFDRKIGHRIRRDDPNERIGKKYQWIAFHEMLARVSDNCEMKEDRCRNSEIVPFRGPWKPYVRDIDPSVLIRKSSSELVDELKGWFSNEGEIYDDSPMYQWVSEDSGIPNPMENIEFKDANGDSWLALVNYPEWIQIHDEEDHAPYKLIWQQIRSYLIIEREYQGFINWAKRQDFSGRWMPEPSSVYEIFEKEYYWSPAYNDVEHDCEQRVIMDSDDGNEYSVNMTCVDYLWESEKDFSKTETISYLRPSKLIFDNLGLLSSDKEGVWVDKQGNVVCFNTSIWHGARECVLIRKDVLLEFLKASKLKIVWVAIGEKNVLRDYTRNSLYNPIEFSGFYYLDDNDNIVGTCKTQFIRARHEREREKSKVNDTEINIFIKKLLTPEE